MPLQAKEGWLQVLLPDGYEGWVRDWHLVPTSQQHLVAFQQRCNARVAVPQSTLRAEPALDALPVAETILGTALVRSATQDAWSAVELPGDRRGWLPEQDLRAGTEAWPPELASILQMLRQFVGVPYVWGGKSPKGFDCSGLMQFVLGLHGLQLPRDSPEQFSVGRSVSGAPAVGDLLFFGDPKIAHVAMQFDDECYLHARGTVRFNSLDPQHALFDAGLARQYRGARRLLTQSPLDSSAS